MAETDVQWGEWHKPTHEEKSRWAKYEMYAAVL
jgi:hypothetical protein